MKKNPLEIQDVEGEEVNVNKVEEALRSVGIMLRDTNGQIRDFDDIILELSGKWNGLSVNTQRYIATIAAGSRQQSRFIALLSDNARLTQLVNDANNAAGASSEQFAKTTESLKTKLQQLENAWNQFILGLTNSTIIKGAVDLLTNFLNVINGLTKNLPGATKNVSNFFLAFGAFKGLKEIANIFGLAMNEASLAKSGGQMGTAFVNSLKNSIAKGGKNISSTIKGFFGKGIDIKTINNLSKIADNSKMLGNNAKAILANKDALNLYNNAINAGIPKMEALRLINTENLAQSTHLLAVKKAEIVQNETGVIATKQQVALNEIELAQKKKNNFETLKNTLAMAFLSGEKRKQAMVNMGLIASEEGAAAATETYTFATFKAIAASKGLSTAIMSIPFIGWILAVIAALTALIALLANIAKNNSLEERTKRMDESISAMRESVDETKESVDNLKSAWDSYKEVRDTLNSLTVGSAEWKQQLVEVNSQVLDLIEKYPLLKEFLQTDLNGVYSIDDTGFVKLNEQLLKTFDLQTQSLSLLEMSRNTMIGNGIKKEQSYYDVITKSTNDWIEGIDWFDTGEGFLDGVIQAALQAHYKPLEWLLYPQNWIADTLSGNTIAKEAEFEDGTREIVENYYRNFYNSVLKGQNEGLTELLAQVAPDKLLASKGNGDYVQDYQKQIEELLEDSGNFDDDRVYFGTIKRSLTSGSKTSSGVFEYAARLADLGYISENYDQSITSQDEMIAEVLAQIEGTTREAIKKKYVDGDDYDAEEAGKKLAQYLYVLNDRYVIERAQEVINNFTGGMANWANDVLDVFSGNVRYQIDKTGKITWDKNLIRGGGRGNIQEKEIKELADALGFDSVDAFYAEIQKRVEQNESAATNIKGQIEKFGISGEEINKILTGNLRLDKSIANTAERIGINDGNITKYFDFIQKLQTEFGDQKTEDGLSKYELALKALNETANTTSGIEFTTDYLRDLGYEFEGCSDEIKGFIGILNDMTLTAAELSNRLKESFSISKDVLQRDENDRSFTEEDYKKILTINPQLARDFVFNGIDYTYIGDSMTNLGEELQKNTLALQEKTKQDYENTIERGERFEQTIADGTTIGNLIRQGRLTNERTDLKYIAHLITKQDEDFYTDWTNDALVKLITNSYERDYGDGGSILNAARAELEELNKDSELTRLINQLTGQDVLNESVNDELTDKALKTKLAIEGITEAYDALEKKINDTLDVNKSLIKAHVIDLNKAGKKVDILKEKWNNVKDTIENSSKESRSYQMAMYQLSKAGAQVFGEGFSKALEEDTTGAFYKWVKTWLEGGSGAAEAYKEIQNQLLKESDINNNFINQLFGMDIDTTISIPFDVKLTDEDIEKLREIGFVISALNGERVVSRGGWSGSISSLLGGGSGSGSDTETPERAFDWLYNLTAYINKEMRERNKLEKEYNLLLSKEGTTVADVHKNLQDRINLLAQENTYQQQMIDKRVQEREQLLKEAAQDNVTKYFDFVNGRPQIKFEQLDRLRIESPDLYELVQQYESKFNEINDEIESAEDAIYDNTSEIEELRNQGRDDFIDLEQTIFDAIVELRENEIKKLEEVNNSINDTNSSLISAIQKQLNKERQSRQNAEKETQIQNKELQLSYLQQSTDADPLKVKQLQEELANLREDYTDTLIDQKINELEEQNEAAKTQRDRQISILNDQLEQDKESGKIWNDVYTYMRDLGEVNSINEIKNLLSNTKEYFTKSDTGKGKFFEDLTSQILSAGAWQKGFTLPVTATLPEGSNFDEVPTNISNIAGNIQDIRDGLTDGTLPKIPITGIPKETPNQDISMPISNMYADQWARGKNTDQIAQNLVSNYGIDTDQLKLAGLAMINGEDIYLQKDSNGRYYLVKRLNNPVFKNKNYSMFATGGLSTETGPAWLDGTPSHPEYVLNPTQTQAFLQLPDLLQQLTNSGAFSTTQSTQSEINGDNYYEINLNVERIDSDYSVDRMAERVKEIIVSDAHYRNVNAVNLLR